MTDAPRFRRSPVALAVVAALAASAAQAQSQEAPSQLPRISVIDEGGEEDTGIKAERVESTKFTQPLLETPQTVETLCRVLRREYEVEPETCTHDVRIVLDGLLREELIQLSPDT